MNSGTGWKPELGISLEGRQVLGYLEALPREVRGQLLQTVARFCRDQGYVSLHGDLASVAADELNAAGELPANVIPFRKAR